jgi:hypothetical protein
MLSSKVLDGTRDRRPDIVWDESRLCAPAACQFESTCVCGTPAAVGLGKHSSDRHEFLPRKIGLR